MLVFGLAEDCRELDAFCFWRHGWPFVLVNTLKSAEHARMDLAHELAHLVLHRNVPEVARAHELEAMRFAGAFLMPKQGMAPYAGRPTLTQVLRIKSAWSVAASALVYRLHELGLVIDWHYRSLMIELNKRGYRSSEPDGLPREQSRLLSQVLHLLRSDDVGLRDIAADLSIEPTELAEMFFGLTLVSAPS